MKSRFTQFAFILSLAAILALLAGNVLAQNTTSATMYPENTITVTGSGTASGAPDIANIEIGVEMVNENVGTAFADANATIQSVINAVVEAGVAREDVRTVGLNVYAQDRYPMSGEVTETPARDYRVSNQIRVTVRDIALIEAVIDAAVQAGANNIYGLNFGISDRDGLEQEARVNAMANAEARAAQLAEIVGAQLGEVIVVNESFGGFGPFDVANYSMMGRAESGGAAIETGQLSVSVQVNVTYRINR